MSLKIKHWQDPLEALQQAVSEAGGARAARRGASAKDAMSELTLAKVERSRRRTITID